MKFTRKQSDSLWVDVTCEGITLLDPVWDNWTGSWCVSEEVGTEALLTGALVRTATVGVFTLQIGPVSGGVTWQTLPAGRYVLTVEVNNTAIDYRQEEQDILIVADQGLV